MTTENPTDSVSGSKMRESASSGVKGFIYGIAPAVVLFFLSPLFGEFLLGNLKFSELYLLPFLALLYGAGALFIREISRRAGRGFPTMLVLAVAYSLIEEGLVTQLLFNESYFPGQAELSETYIAAVGIDAWLTIIVIGMHTVWSICIPIILVESLFSNRGTNPWLGIRGLVLSFVIFVFGSAFIGYETYLETGFMASIPQLLGVTTIVGLLVFVAYSNLQPPDIRVVDVSPNPVLVGGVAFVASTVFMLTEYLPGWPAVGACLLIIVGFFMVVSPWPNRPEWGALHRLAFAGGGILTYSWLGLVMEPETGPRSLFDQLGSLLIVCIAIGLFVLAVTKLRTNQNGSPTSVNG